MRSTFMGLEASKRGLFTQQSALYTTGHNISNANTEGYSRQRVNMEPTLGFPTPGLNTQKTAGHIGTGVQAHSVQRIRDEFIDRQFRQETNKLGYWESRTQAISQMEDILAEPSKYGLDEAFRLLWNSLEDLSANPEEASTRKVVIQRAQHLADSFNYINIQLEQIQGNLGNEIKVSTSRINSILKQIADINRQIQEIEPNGYMPNDLYDSRDTLIDELNEYLPVDIKKVESGGNALDIAEGSLTIQFKSEDGKVLDLVNGKNYVELKAMGSNSAEIDESDITNLFSHFSVTELADYAAHEKAKKTGPALGSNTVMSEIKQEHISGGKGKLLSLIDSYGFENASGDKKGYYPETLDKLDKLAKVFIDAFNELHKLGHGLPPTSSTGKEFFQGSKASDIAVRDEIIKDPNLIAASSAAEEEGNGKWALELANIQSKFMSSDSTNTFSVTVDGNEKIIKLTDHLDGATFQSFYQGLIAKLGTDGEESTRLKTNAETIRLTVENNRASMSSVSLDEEMTDMIRFQQAYNANARMITVIDETLDKIINGMGRVGL